MSRSDNRKKHNKDNKPVKNTKKRNKETTKSGKEQGFWKRHKKFATFLKVMVVLFILVCIAGAGAIIALFNNDDWAMKKEDLTSKSVDTIIYDKDGTEIANVSGEEKRRTVTLDEVPQMLQDAYISIEDERFYTHHGVDIKRTLGATATYIIRRGSSSYGGSTITQQLVKNLMNDDDDSGVAGIQRKIREMSRAYKLEQWFSKQQILELYLNTIFVGSDVYGVQLGARYYFDKSVQDLDLAECAFLAGINHAPNSYNPFGEKDNSERIKNRTKTVLSKMLELGKITQEEYDSAKQEVEDGLKFSQGNTSSGTSMSYLARAAYNQVIKEFAAEKDVSTKIATQMIAGGGYKIYTTQDSTIQGYAEEVYRSGDHIFYGVATKNGEKVNSGHTQSAIVIIDHKTGYVVGCMGGLGDDVDSNGQNRATQSPRQPGSSIKPLAAVAPALESGIITAATVYDESRTSFGNYSPNPHSGYDLVTVRKAIEFSANTVNVKIMDEVGPANSIAFMRKMGISTLITAKENAEHNDENLSLVLGGATEGITPLEMAGAYATIANNGVYITPTFYTKVEDSSGSVVLEPKQEKNRVMSEANSYILKSILTGPVTGSNGTATSAKISGQATAGKTGTTNDNYDRWFCGFTNYYTAAAWYGFDIPENLYYAGANYPNRAASLWTSVMKKIHSGLESNTSFEKPSNIVTAKICKTSGKVATDDCTDTYTEYFVKGTVPDYCDGHTKLTICKDTGKIATEFCPNTEEKTYTKKPEKENTTLWKTNDGDKYNIPTETCTTHTKKTIKVTNVVGKKQADAKAALEKLGLKVTVETKTSTKDDGIVLSQSLKEGTEVKTGDKITIVVSKKKTSAANEVVNNTVTPSNNTVSNNTTGKNTISSNEV